LVSRIIFIPSSSSPSYSPLAQAPGCSLLYEKRLTKKGKEALGCIILNPMSIKEPPVFIT
jgi:hypothetical protein